MKLARLTPAATAPDLLAVAVDPVTCEVLRQGLGQLGCAPSRVSEGGLAAAIALLRATPSPAVLVVDISDCADPLRDLDQLAEVCEPQTRVLAIGAANDVRLYRELRRLGVADYLPKPLAADQLRTAVEALLAADPPPSAATPAVAGGATVAVIGARSGCGATSLAVSLAWGLANDQQQRTVLLDLDLQAGTTALSLDAEPGRGLRELLANPERLDKLLIGSAAVQQGERLRLLAAEEPLDADLRLGGEGLDALVGVLRADGDSLVIDLPRRFDALCRSALRAADTVIVVTDLSLAGLRDTQRLLPLVTACAGGAVLLAGGRVGATPGELSASDFQRHLQRRLDVELPFDAKAARAAAEQARPLLSAVRGGPLADALQRLLATVAGGGATATLAGAPRAPLLKRWFGS